MEYNGAMPSIPERGLAEAKRLGLDLGVQLWNVPTKPFVFKGLVPPESMVEAFKRAKREGLPWVPGMPKPVLIYHPKEDQYEIMDGIRRIASAKKAKFKEVPAFVARGYVYDALEPLFQDGYYGEDYIEMLAMANPEIRENLELTNKTKLAGVR